MVETWTTDVRAGIPGRLGPGDGSAGLAGEDLHAGGAVVHVVPPQKVGQPGAKRLVHDRRRPHRTATRINDGQAGRRGRRSGPPCLSRCRRQSSPSDPAERCFCRYGDHHAVLGLPEQDQRTCRSSPGTKPTTVLPDSQPHEHPTQQNQ